MKKDMFRRILMIVGLVTILGVISACAPAAAPPTPTPTKAPAAAPTAAKPAAEAPKPAPPKTVGTEIKIGFIQPFSGVLGDFGPRHWLAADIAVKEINAAGGINGVPLKLLKGDTRSDEPEAIKLTQMFASDDKVLAMVGDFSSPGMAVSAPHAVKAKVPIITGAPFMPGVGKDNAPWAFSNELPDPLVVAVSVKASIKKYNIKKLASIYAIDQGYVKGLGELIMAGFKGQGIDVLDPIPIKIGDTDFTAAMTRLKGQVLDQGADAVAISNSGRSGGAMAVEMRRQGIKIPVVSSGILADAGLIATGGEAVEGTLVGTAFWEENPDPVQVRFAKEYTSRAKAEGLKVTDVGGKTSNFYDIIRLLAKVMKEGGITNAPGDLAKDREIIMKGLQAIKDFDGVGTKLTMGPEGQVTREVFVTIVQGGKFVRLKD